MIAGSNWMWAEACALIERAERLQRDFYRPSAYGDRGGSWEPPIDVYESTDGIWVAVALPGVEPRDLTVTIETDVLRVSGVRRLRPPQRDAAIHRLEIPHGRFERSIRLAAGGCELTRSEFENGCLYLMLTKLR
jgi:HSP20 family protein